MKCPSCGFDNAAGVKFCGECGGKLDTTPAPVPCACGFVNPPGTKFCGECGARLGTTTGPAGAVAAAAPVGAARGQAPEGPRGGTPSVGVAPEGPRGGTPSVGVAPEGPRGGTPSVGVAPEGPRGGTPSVSEGHAPGHAPGQVPPVGPAVDLSLVGATPTGAGPVYTAALALPQPGSTVVGRFVVEARLGQGGMGAVYRARDTRLDREVALKFLLGLSPDALARFHREAKSLARLEHKNIVHVHDDIDTEHGPCLVMQYLAGESLLDRIRKAGKLAPAEAVRLAVAVCDGLEYAHRNQVIHRDIKPSNILIAPGGEARIVDFGIARGIGPATFEQIGTPGYMAPEQEEGGTIDSRTDIYALGAMLYHMLSGQRPGVLRLDLVPEVLRPAIARATAPRPADRFPNVVELRQALERAVARPAQVAAPRPPLPFFGPPPPSPLAPAHPPAIPKPPPQPDVPHAMRCHLCRWEGEAAGQWCPRCGAMAHLPEGTWAPGLWMLGLGALCCALLSVFGFILDLDYPDEDMAIGSCFFGLLALGLAGTAWGLFHWGLRRPPFLVRPTCGVLILASVLAAACLAAGGRRGEPACVSALVLVGMPAGVALLLAWVEWYVWRRRWATPGAEK